MFTSTVELLAALGGLFATAIVVGGFLAHVRPAIAGKGEAELRRATATGGLVGLVVVSLVLVGIRLVT